MLERKYIVKLKLFLDFKNTRVVWKIEYDSLNLIITDTNFWGLTKWIKSISDCLKKGVKSFCNLIVLNQSYYFHLLQFSILWKKGYLKSMAYNFSRIVLNLFQGLFNLSKWSFLHWFFTFTTSLLCFL